jgi:hypothetical protein
MQEIIREIFLDDVALVAAADHEVVGAVRRVELHDVPEDGLAADLDHRLRLQIALFGYPSAQPPGENDDLHGPCAGLGIDKRRRTPRRRHALKRTIN